MRRVPCTPGHEIHSQQGRQTRVAVRSSSPPFSPSGMLSGGLHHGKTFERATLLTNADIMFSFLQRHFLEDVQK